MRAGQVRLNHGEDGGQMRSPLARFVGGGATDRDPCRPRSRPWPGSCKTGRSISDLRCQGIRNPRISCLEVAVDVYGLLRKMRDNPPPMFAGRVGRGLAYRVSRGGNRERLRRSDFGRHDGRVRHARSGISGASRLDARLPHPRPRREQVRSGSTARSRARSDGVPRCR